MFSHIDNVHRSIFKRLGRGVPGGPLVEDLPSKAGDAGLISAWGTKIPHATEQQSLHTAAVEARML